MKEIPLTKGHVALVDDADYEWLSQWRWHAKKRKDGKFVAETQTNGRKVYMHRLIAQTPRGMHTDHKDANPLNNQRFNLRSCSAFQNSVNKTKTRGTSRYKGVRRATDCNRWRSQISFDGKTIHLGNFISETDAARAYDIAARQYFGDFALLNFPE